MFTGIVQSQAQVIAIKSAENFARLTVAVDNNFIKGLTPGASVANNGVCLTTVSFSQHTENKAIIDFDVIDETLRVTNLSRLTVGDWLNIERSLKAGDEIGGHMVSGHIHCQAHVLQRIDTTDNCQLVFHCDKKYSHYIFNKGFISINGVSLTVGEVKGQEFSVHLIPETLSRTNIGQLQQGDFVNIEVDQQTMTIVDTIERMNLTIKK